MERQRRVEVVTVRHGKRQQPRPAWSSYIPQFLRRIGPQSPHPASSRLEESPETVFARLGNPRTGDTSRADALVGPLSCAALLRGQVFAANPSAARRANAYMPKCRRGRRHHKEGPCSPTPGEQKSRDRPRTPEGSTDSGRRHSSCVVVGSLVGKLAGVLAGLRAEGIGMTAGLSNSSLIFAGKR